MHMSVSHCSTSKYTMLCSHSSVFAPYNENVTVLSLPWKYLRIIELKYHYLLEI